MLYIWKNNEKSSIIATTAHLHVLFLYSSVVMSVLVCVCVFVCVCLSVFFLRVFVYGAASVVK